MATQNEPKNKISIPNIANYEMRERNIENAYAKDMDHCPVCGKAISNPQFFIKSIYGGSMYPKTDMTNYDDAWIMGIGSECRKKIPSEYIMNVEELNRFQ